MRPNQEFKNLLNIGNTYQFVGDTTDVTYFHDSPNLYPAVSSGFEYNDRSQTLITSLGGMTGSPQPSIVIISGDIRLGSQWGMVAGDGVYSIIAGGMVSPTLPTIDGTYYEIRMSIDNNYVGGVSGVFIYARVRRVAGTWVVNTGYIMNGVNKNPVTITISPTVKMKLIYVESTKMGYIYYQNGSGYGTSIGYTLASSYDLSPYVSGPSVKPYYIRYIYDMNVTYNIEGTLLSNRNYGLDKGTYNGYEAFPPVNMLFGTSSRY